MHVRLRLFATARDAVGADECSIELPEGSDVSRLRAHLADEHPELVAMWERLAIAVDGELADPDRRITDGAEVALLPPVSGGARGRLTTETIDVDPLVDRVVGPERGAVVTFLGVVRDHHDGRTVSRLDYSAYETMAETTLRRIAHQLEDSLDEGRVEIVHRLGNLEIGETSLAIAVASPHRRAAFAVAREALERVKREVPIWKREHYADGSALWREEEPLQRRSVEPTIPERREVERR